MSREEEYKQKCRQVKDYYLEEICEHEDAGCLGDADAFHEVAVWLDSRCRFNE